MDTNTYNRSLPLLAAALSEQRNIKVEIGGEKAFTDGKTIHLPSLPLDADESLHSVAAGFLDHESAHVLFSEFNALNNAQLTPLEKFLANCVEDVRIEALMADRYPGSARNLRDTARHVFIDKAGEANTDPAFAVPNYVLLRLRSQACPELAFKAQEAATVVALHFPGLVTELEDVFADIKECCPDTAASISYGKRIAELLETYEQQHASQSTVNSNAGNADDDGDKSADGDAEDKSASDGTSSSPDADGSEQGKSDAAPEMQPSLASLFADDAAKKLPKGLGEALSEELESSRSSDPYEGFTNAIEVPASFKPMPQDMQDQTLCLQSILRPKLRGVLQADTYDGCMPATQGKLNSRRLYSVPLGNQHVFVRHIPAKLLSTAVHILIDRSGSTLPIVRDIAMSAYAVAHAAAGLRGISVGMTVFPVGHPNEGACPGVSTIMRHGQVAPRLLAFNASGSTPLAEATWHALGTLMKQREPRKILMIFTDGQADSEDKVKAALRDAEHLGVELYGVSFRNTSIVGLLGPHRSAVIQEIDELATSLSTMLLTALRRAA